MTNDEKIEFYASVYNTIQEMVRTAKNNDIYLGALENYLQNIENHIGVGIIKQTNDLYTKEQKEKFVELTDRLEDRIYFNL